MKQPANRSCREQRAVIAGRMLNAPTLGLRIVSIFFGYDALFDGEALLALRTETELKD